MPRTRHYYVYIMANEAKMIYTGVTNDIERRVFEHKAKLQDSFTKRYNMTRLVYMEDYSDVIEAIQREKQIKVRGKKIALIEEDNPLWQDLAEGWYHDLNDSSLRSE
ncbi:MAG: GIY-YIG nuclease family protein [Dehalococcoidia bacterium]